MEWDGRVVAWGLQGALRQSCFDISARKDFRVGEGTGMPHDSVNTHQVCAARCPGGVRGTPEKQHGEPESL